MLDHAKDVVGRITIGNYCFIGQNSVIILEVTLGERCVVGAGAAVTHSHPPHSVIDGNPARVIRTTAEMAKNISRLRLILARSHSEQETDTLLSIQKC